MYRHRDFALVQEFDNYISVLKKPMILLIALHVLQYVFMDLQTYEETRLTSDD